MSVTCDHTSVGVLVWQTGKLLMIERRKRPFGISPPSGHVDEHGSFEDAARNELKEEVGLAATKLTLVRSGAHANPCRRTDGNWHYWRIFEAEASGALEPSEGETKGARWYNLAEMALLLQRTREYQAGRISETEWQAQPGIEPVWREIFEELNLISPKTARSVAASSPADVKWAREYAWKWFDYHAAQRITIFRFYLIFVALLVAGYSTLTIEGQFGSSIGAALFLVIATVLFMRLDERNKQLVKLGEDFLKEEEAKVAEAIGSSTIRIASGAETKKHRHFCSFRQIYGALFWTIFVMSAFMVGRSLWLIYVGAPEMREIAASISVRDVPVIKSQSVPARAPRTISQQGQSSPPGEKPH